MKLYFRIWQRKAIFMNGLVIFFNRSDIIIIEREMFICSPFQQIVLYFLACFTKFNVIKNVQKRIAIFRLIIISQIDFTFKILNFYCFDGNFTFFARIPFLKFKF